MKKSILTTSVLLFSLFFGMNAMAQDNATTTQAPVEQCAKVKECKNGELKCDKAHKHGDMKCEKAAKQVRAAKHKDCMERRQKHLDSLKATLSPEEYTKTLEKAFISGKPQMKKHGKDCDKKQCKD